MLLFRSVTSVTHMGVVCTRPVAGPAFARRAGRPRRDRQAQRGAQRGDQRRTHGRGDPETFSELGAGTMPVSPEEFAQIIDAETQEWARVVRRGKIKPA